MGRHLFTAGAVFAAHIVAGNAQAQTYTVDPGLVPAVALADCTPRAAMGNAMFEAVKRKGALAAPTLKLLKEFETLNNKSTSKGDEPMWKGLSTTDAIRATEVSAKVAQLNGLSYSDSAYERDLRIIDMMFSDALTEYSTTSPPVLSNPDPKSEEQLAYTVLLAMREGLDGGKDDPASTPNQTVCSVDLAFYRATAAPMAKYNSLAADASRIQSITDRLKSKYGQKLNPADMGPEDAEAYTIIATFLASANRTQTYISDLENLRMLAAAAAIRRDGHITDQLAGGTDTDYGATLRKRAASGEFSPSMTKALIVQDKLSELFPTDEIKAAKAFAESSKK